MSEDCHGADAQHLSVYAFIGIILDNSWVRFPLEER